MLYELAIELDGEGLLVTAPSFPELTTFGATLEEALAQGRLALEEAIAGRIADGEDIPIPENAVVEERHFVRLAQIVFLKSALYMIMRSKGKTRADLMRTLGWHREQVDRLFRLEHNSTLNQLEAAYQALQTPLRFDVPFPANDDRATSPRRNTR